MKIGIAPAKPTQEGQQLITAARNIAEVFVVDPHNLWVAFDGPRAVVFSGKIDISDLDYLFVRRTKGMGASLSVLVRALAMNGCDVVDPIDRYSVGYASKLKSSIQRFQDGCGPATYFAFSLAAANDMVTYMRNQNVFRSGRGIIKPIAGRHSDGKVIVSTAKSTRPHVRDFFATRSSTDEPFFMQKFEDITHEYRVILANGFPIAVVFKSKKNNLTTGSTFTPVSTSTFAAIGMQARHFCTNEGIVGVDIGLTSDHRVVVIEENRAPEWHRVVEVTGADVARQIVRQITGE